jgi:hypothetical protein
MSPEEPGAPDDAPRDPPGRPTFRSDVEPTEAPAPTNQRPDGGEPRPPEPPTPPDSAPAAPESAPPRAAPPAGRPDATGFGGPASPPPREPERPTVGGGPSEPARSPAPPGPAAPATPVPPVDRGVDPVPGAAAVVAPASLPHVRDPELPIPDAEPAEMEEGPPRKVVPPGRRRFLDDPDPDAPAVPRRQKVRLRKVQRVVRHIEPWSVLKISVVFFASIFLIICIASAVLWNAARSAGAIDDVESFITSLGFGNCEDIDGDTAETPETPSTVDPAQPQVGGPSTSTSTTLAEPEDERSAIPDEDGKCAEGQRLVGGFEFEDQRIFQSFALFGVVLVLSGAATSVVLVLLFNLISDLTGGVRVTVLEEDPVRVRTGSPPARTDD